MRIVTFHFLVFFRTTRCSFQFKGFSIVECASCQKAFNPIHAMYFVLNVITEIHLVKVWSLQGFFTWCKVELEWHRSRNTNLFIFYEDDQNINMPIKTVLFHRSRVIAIRLGLFYVFELVIYCWSKNPLYCDEIFWIVAH